MASEDPIHEQVQQYLASYPEAAGQIRKLGDGEYLIDGREVKVGFCRQGFLVVHDGPLRQPFTDYVEKKEATAVYHSHGLKTSSLNAVPKEIRISFGDEGNRYSRLDAMKVAKEQAAFREKAANYVSEGQVIPGDLHAKYQKAIDTKLGTRRWSAKPVSVPERAGPSWWPGATPAPVPAPAAPPSHVPPMMAMPSSPQGQASGQGGNLFGQVPNLLGAVQARKNRMSFAAPLATTTVPMPGVQVGGMKAGYPHVQGPVAGRLCGA